MFKFKLNDTVFFMVDNKVSSSIVKGRKLVEYDQPKGMAIFDKLGKAGAEYETANAVKREEELFASKEELLASL